MTSTTCVSPKIKYASAAAYLATWAPRITHLPIRPAARRPIHSRTSAAEAILGSPINLGAHIAALGSARTKNFGEIHVFLLTLLIYYGNGNGDGIQSQETYPIIPHTIPYSSSRYVYAPEPTLLSSGPVLFIHSFTQLTKPVFFARCGMNVLRRCYASMGMGIIIRLVGNY